IERLLTCYKLWYGYRDNFPKKSRYTLGDKIDTRFLNILELLSIAANQPKHEKEPTLNRALVGVDALKFLLRIAWELNILDDVKYEKISTEVDESGRQIGGWKKG